jgi:hypothetical protein
MHPIATVMPAAREPTAGLRLSARGADDWLVAIIPRMFRARTGARLSVLLAWALTAVSLSAACFAAPAGAKVVEVATGSGTTAVGLQPRNAASFLDGESGSDFENPSGNPVLHGTQASGGIETYAIYWDPTDHYHGDWQHLIDNFFHNMGAEGGAFNSIFSVATQYTDKTDTPAASHSTFRGAYTDTNAYPTAGCTDPQPLEAGDAITCLTDKQVRTELSSFIAAHDLTTGMGSIFYLLTPPGVAVCIDEGGAASHCSSNHSVSPANGFCSYHSDINLDGAVNGDASTILYADIPWVAGGLGDFHLHAGSRNTEAYACQDGGLDPSTKPIEQKEKAKEKNAEEKTAFEKMDAEEKAKITKAEALEGPRVQEPNQDGLGPDGSYDTGLADVLVNQIAVEQQNTVTDPLLDAWQGQDATRDEETDECRNFFASGDLGGASAANEETIAGSLSNQNLNGGHYYLNNAFNLASLKLPYPAVPCVGGIHLAPDFTSPNPVNVNEIVGFDGMESDITLNAADFFPPVGAATNTYANYTWNFGDETAPVSGFAPGAPACTTPWLSPCAASVFHSYQYGGEYNVTLTVTDVGGNTFSETHTVVVHGPAKPAPAAPPAPPAATGSSGGSSTSTAAGGTTPGSAPASKPSVAPVATAAVNSTSLKSVLAKGLSVRYSVNEQVTGHFEVLLAASVAKKIGLKGALATGLPKGTAPEIVVAKAILVTTQGGHNSVKILFGKKTAKLLRKLHKVSLMVRLIVRNGLSSSATSTTTVNSLVTLTH